MRLLRIDHSKDLRTITIENDQAVHVACKAEMLILGLVKAVSVTVQCSRCRLIVDLDKSRLYDLGLWRKA